MKGYASSTLQAFGAATFWLVQDRCTWGRGASLSDAIAQARAAGGMEAGTECIVMRCDPKAYVDGHGTALFDTRGEVWKGTVVGARDIRLLSKVAHSEEAELARVREARALLESALASLDQPAERLQQAVGSALWRAADAAGLLSEISRMSRQGTKGEPTGRGYFISKV